MEAVKQLFDVTLMFMQHDMTVFGFTFSYWDILMFSCVAGIIGYVLSRVFGGD